mmetsp:Transcript_37145/g.72013  ORF Transcript_37145/g.72013 Transcript_37145/m.72013 type:complete len:256 (+) Transcript_37145:2131-2898(+)
MRFGAQLRAHGGTGDRLDDMSGNSTCRGRLGQRGGAFFCRRIWAELLHAWGAEHRKDGSGLGHDGHSRRDAVKVSADVRDPHRRHACMGFPTEQGSLCSGPSDVHTRLGHEVLWNGHGLNGGAIRTNLVHRHSAWVRDHVGPSLPRGDEHLEALVQGIRSMPCCRIWRLRSCQGTNQHQSAGLAHLREGCGRGVRVLCAHRRVPRSVQGCRRHRSLGQHRELDQSETVFQKQPHVDQGERCPQQVGRATHKEEHC